MIAASISDYREIARQRLPPFLFEYLDGGSCTETTLRRNITDLELIVLRQRVLRDVSEIDLCSELFGEPLAMPIVLGPVGLAGMVARRGECQAVRAADAARLPFTLSTVSACSIREVAKASASPFWFQLYMVRDREFMNDLMAQAVEAGCRTLVFTVDMPVPGTRYRDHHSGLTGAAGFRSKVRRLFQGAMHPAWAWDVGIMGRPHNLGNVAPLLADKSGAEDFFTWMRNNFDPSISWRDLEFIRESWKGPLVIKGVLDPADAREAAALGADGLIVSNHGGRQLDGALSTARALPAISKAVGDKLTIMADGGIRSGLDVVRMIALGAKAVVLGRAWAWALGAAGERGVGQMLEIIRTEMLVAMALTGTTKISEIDSTILVGQDWEEKSND